MVLKVGPQSVSSLDSKSSSSSKGNSVDIGMTPISKSVNPVVQAAQSVHQASEIASDNFPGSDLIDGLLGGLWDRVYPYIEGLGSVGVLVLTFLLAAIIRNPTIIASAALL